MAAILPFLSRIPFLVWAVLAVAGVYLVLIAVLSVTAVYSAKPARRRAAADMVRILWFTHSRDE
ncbi:hypothetical protein [Streptomyces olivochromogenes]|uniref:hypothetical protein n=1 Tax=Streptomyces olivochromogenes TaxID=1963 RepID=UPI001F2885E2|nr:hypothetical protein [Streptomyces olivochromogenes]MCF3132425.1 hypothetical protein [Streptomyces olivochromogenes]